MKILYIGDVMGEAGQKTVEQVLLGLRRERSIDFVIAQAENVTAGRGISQHDFSRLKKAGVDFCTGGNHIFDNDEIFSLLSDPAQPIIRPANYPPDKPGLGWKYAKTNEGDILIMSVLGSLVGRNAALVLANPLQTIDTILASQKDVPRLATIVNFHGDYSSEKVVVGHYLDGRVTAVIGDHWHVPTADARILPEGTAHITDVGMVGILNSSLGVKAQVIIDRWKDQKQNHNILATDGPRQFNAVLITTKQNGLAQAIEQVQAVV
jgi:hypothetical protein